MRLESISIRDFKRFSNLIIEDIPATASLVMLTGPNGSGKTSLFEAFNYYMDRVRGTNNFDKEYHPRVGFAPVSNDVFDRITLTFHDSTKTNIGVNSRHRKLFYIRSSYRHEADFTSNELASTADILDDPIRAIRLIFPEARVAENYRRIVADSILTLYDDTKNDKSGKAIKEEIIGEIRTVMMSVFEDLVLEGPGNPLQGGTFRFEKGTSKGFHYKNLSGGEKAAFDLLLDFIIKRRAFDDTVFCIDEPELHMHTRLQAKLLDALFALVPANCQLWISTHSIGMARKAADLSAVNAGQVAFIDFHDQDFDQPVILKPVRPDRTFWKNMFATALDDLAELVVPGKVIFCEGKRLGTGGRRPAFDMAVYSRIFSASHPDTDFVPLGGTNQVQADGELAGVLLKKLAPGIQTWMVFDRDDHSETEIQDLKNKGIHVLSRRDLENYLWDDEILDKLASSQTHPQDGEPLKAEKARLLSAVSVGTPTDDIKAISGQLYNFCKKHLSLTGCGNDAEAFARDTLAPLVTPETEIYQELERIIFTRPENRS